MSELKEYIITLKSYDDLDQFYEDMETEGGDLYIPNRSVDLLYRRPSSRNTHYLLTNEEAQTLKNDFRVENVTLNAVDQGLQIVPMAFLTKQTSSHWRKSNYIDEYDLNWGVLRCYEGSTRTNWGLDGTSNVVSGTVNLTNIGRNVDVVVADGIINPNHPEYSVNYDGSGGSRVVRYNWFQHNPQVKGTSAGTYNYNGFITQSNVGFNDHGTHVAGTCAGNTLGWARAANIYNIWSYDTAEAAFIIDYIKLFHRSKSVNPITGIKNPTIVNMSFGFSTGNIPFNSITQIRHRGIVYNKPTTGWTSTQLKTFGVWSVYSWYYNAISSTVHYPPLDADITDAINEGVIFCGAASNEGTYEDISGGLDWDNAFVYNGAAYFYHRGPSPGASEGVITVGAVDATVREQKADYSNTGPRINIFAPGSRIMSAHVSDGVHDARVYSYLLTKLDGTSMATPQVTGVLACMLEAFPNSKQSDALSYLMKYCTSNQLFDNTPTNYDDFNSLRGAPNKFLRYRQERNLNGVVYPKNNYLQFKQTSIKFPTNKIRRKG